MWLKVTFFKHLANTSPLDISHGLLYLCDLNFLSALLLNLFEMLHSPTFQCNMNTSARISRGAAQDPMNSHCTRCLPENYKIHSTKPRHRIKYLQEVMVQEYHKCTATQHVNFPSSSCILVFLFFSELFFFLKGFLFEWSFASHQCDVRLKRSGGGGPKKKCNTCSNEDLSTTKYLRGPVKCVNFKYCVQLAYSKCIPIYASGMCFCGSSSRTAGPSDASVT